MKEVINFIVHTLIVTIVSIILVIFILPNLKFINLGNILNNETFNISDVIGILSLNLGILQGLMALFGMGIALAAYFNFTQIRDKTKKLEKNYKKLKKQYSIRIKELDIKTDEVDRRLSSFIDDYNITANANRQEEE